MMCAVSLIEAVEKLMLQMRHLISTTWMMTTYWGPWNLLRTVKMMTLLFVMWLLKFNLLVPPATDVQATVADAAVAAKT